MSTVDSCCLRVQSTAKLCVVEKLRAILYWVLTKMSQTLVLLHVMSTFSSHSNPALLVQSWLGPGPRQCCPDSPRSLSVGSVFFYVGFILRQAFPSRQYYKLLGDLESHVNNLTISVERENLSTIFLARALDLTVIGLLWVLF